MQNATMLQKVRFSTKNNRLSFVINGRDIVLNNLYFTDSELVISFFKIFEMFDFLSAFIQINQKHQTSSPAQAIKTINKSRHHYINLI